MSVPAQLLADLRCIAPPQMRFLMTGAAKNARFAVLLHAQSVVAGAPQGLKFNALGSTSLIAGCEWWCRTANDGAAEPTAVGCLQALGLPRETMAELLLIEDAWVALLRQSAASSEV